MDITTIRELQEAIKGVEDYLIGTSNKTDEYWVEIYRKKTGPPTNKTLEKTVFEVCAINTKLEEAPDIQPRVSSVRYYRFKTHNQDRNEE